MPKFVLIGSDSRLTLMADLAAIAELVPVDSDGVRGFEATWQAQVLRVETPIARDPALVAARTADADLLLLVVSEADGMMAVDVADLNATPDHVELSAVILTNAQPDPDIRTLVTTEIMAHVVVRRPRWHPRYVDKNCDAFFHILKHAFFTDCL